jgi:hypothetical protein
VRYAKNGMRRCKKCQQRIWAERHPIAYAWAIHRQNARQRGVTVEWTRDEFIAFCEITGYHLKKSDGYVIHRMNHNHGYSIDNCIIIPKQLNSELGNWEKKWKNNLAEKIKSHQKQFHASK